MTGQDAVKASAMCYWRTSCASDRGLMCDFWLIISQVALRGQLCHVFPIINALLHADLSSVAADLHFFGGFYGGINVTFMPLLFTPVVCENVSCADPSRHLPGGRFTLRPQNRSWVGPLAAAVGEDSVCVSPPPVWP